MNDNRMLILQTACQLFSQQGFDAVGVQEICETAGFTKPTLYHYFGSKQGLLAAIVEHYLTPFNQQLNSALHYQGDVQTSLRNIFNLYLDFADHNARFFRLWMSIRLSPIQSTTYQTILPYTQKHQTDLLNFFRNVSTQHGNLLGRELILATSFQGLLFTYASMVLQGEIEITQPRIHQAVHQFMHGIFS
ncbi:MAG: TetR/AcrR family transcriptional regulator [Anaerolineaceae bacterium]|jgi:TetR/AcrR family transcriptional regulator|nr:TetR/AcrR family transcriptional regulator [Anaerolineaceae bacterium]